MGEVPHLWETPHEAENEREKYLGFSLSPALHLPSVPLIGQMQIEAN